ncbi:MAG: DNA-binding protein [Candidatus Thermoplasmatota archaeon]|nr:DNA-binding protein [Candidatus Thermoplasmatota archaeon]
MPEDEELEAIRRRKLQELQSGYAQQQARAEQQQQVDAQKQMLLRQITTPEARERLARVKLSRPDVAGVVEDQILSLGASGRLDRIIDDEMMRMLLDRLIPKKREIKIERR